MINQAYYTDAPAYCKSYFDLLPSDDLLGLLQSTAVMTQNVFERVPAQRHDYAYSTGKWTVKEVLQHIIDCERINAYRALRFSRFDPTELPGFDEDNYIEAVKPITTPLAALLEEYHDVRRATIRLFAPLNDAMLDFKGRANQHPYTARTLGFMTIGHNMHHCRIVTEKYGENG